MNIEIAKKKLEKINRLLDTFEPGDNHVSRLEKDLIMSYTREFYEAIAEPINGTIKHPKPKTQSTHIPSAPATKVQTQAEPQPKQEIKEEIIVQKYTEQEKQPERVISEKIVEEAIAVKPVVEKTQTTPEPKTTPKQTKIIQEEAVVEVAQKAEEAPIKETAEVATATISKSTINPELLELFSIKKANEISEKLSQLPITDLNKAMGVNEKIFVKNELFGGDDNVFKSTLSRLNTFQNFDEAKDYLASEVAGSFEWTAPDKSKKAKNFIQLVYRRYK